MVSKSVPTSCGNKWPNPCSLNPGMFLRSLYFRSVTLGLHPSRPTTDPPPPPPLPPPTRATVSQDCITAYNDLKLSKKYKFIIFKLSDDFKQIVIEDASTEKDWDAFREKLINATTKSKSVSLHRELRMKIMVLLMREVGCCW